MAARTQDNLVIHPRTVLGFALIYNSAPLLTYFGLLGLTGFTAWLGIIDISRSEPGMELLVLAAVGAVGAVGSTAGQFGRKLCARIIEDFDACGGDLATVAMQGQVTQYSGASEIPCPSLMPVLLRLLELNGFLAYDHNHWIGDFTFQVKPWQRKSGLYQAVSISSGTKSLREAINIMANGRNFGQQLHQLCSEEDLARALGKGVAE